MSNKYFSGQKGHYIFCDICGQACYDTEATKLQLHTGRPGLLVCPNDKDKIDYGLVPFQIPHELSVKYARISDPPVITNGTAPIDPDVTPIGV